MKNIFVALLIFIFVMCFFFIPHGGASQPPKAEFSIMGICQDDSSLRIGAELCLAPMAQMSPINLNTTHDNYLLCEATYASTQTALKYDKAEALVDGITGHKAIKPWRSFHAGK